MQEILTHQLQSSHAARVGFSNWLGAGAGREILRLANAKDLMNAAKADSARLFTKEQVATTAQSHLGPEGFAPELDGKFVI